MGGRKRIKLKKIKYIFELRALVREGKQEYSELAMCAARNLGGAPKTFDDAIQWLVTNANETDENGVVAEINGVRDIVENQLNGNS